MAAKKDKGKRSPRARDTAGPTFGEMLEARALLTKASKETRTVIASAAAYMTAEVKKHLQVISCFNCSAPKGCCHLTTMAMLYEAVPIAARLRREGRDTADLRHRLRVAAEDMEALSPNQYRRPCVFLSSDERCTVYEDRPFECGAAFVTSPPPQCSDPNAVSITKVAHPFGQATGTNEGKFEHDASLEPLRGPYMGALPRMVLLCLQAWERPDYARFLAQRAEAAATGPMNAYFADSSAPIRSK